jgi:predicted ATPase
VSRCRDVRRRRKRQRQVDDLRVSGYGHRSLHAQSHGEAFLSLAIHRFGGKASQLIIGDFLTDREVFLRELLEGEAN